MQFLTRLSLAATMLLPAAIGHAHVEAIGPFIGSSRESFEHQPGWGFNPCIPGRIFGGKADLCSVGGNMHIALSWSFQCALDPFEGEFLAGAVSGTAELRFDTPVRRFGGYFALNSGVSDATVLLFDSADNLLSTQVMTMPADCAWRWNGWDQGDGPPIARARFIGNAFDGAFVMFDDLQADFCLAANTYCSSKTNSLGCEPSIAAEGFPSASAGHGFHVVGRDVLNNKAGFLTYSTTGSALLPFAAGWLCSAPPLRRTPTQNSAGNPGVNNCSGAYSIDMNRFASGALGGSPAPELSQPGTSVYCQWVARDPGFPGPNNISLSNGLHYIVCP